MATCKPSAKSSYEVGAREELVRYLTRNISFSLDEGMRAGLELFFHLAHKHGVTQSLRPLKFLGTDVE